MLWALLLPLLVAPAGLHAADNTGLGPLSIRNQFPVALGFLNFTPDAPGILPASTFQLRYQFALTNTFVNTQSPLTNPNTPITAAEAARGIAIGDFPPTGYGVYVDVETQRHLLRMDYALGDSVEIGLELAWVSFGGGLLDSRIEGVERLAGGLNEDRTFSDQDRFDFYVARDGAFLQASSQPATGVMQDPVLNLKWNLGEGGDVLPALTLKLSYKRALEDQPNAERALVSSGRSDVGYYVLLAKAVADVVGHFQFGTTRLDVAPNTYAERLTHRMFGLEFRVDSEQSIVLQSVTQTSIFIKSEQLGTTDFDISRPTDVLVAGYKSADRDGLFEVGFIEDYNQQRNESDVTFFFEWGWRW